MLGARFTLRTLLMATLVVAAFCGGIAFERVRKRREDERPGTAGPAYIYSGTMCDWTSDGDDSSDDE